MKQLSIANDVAVDTDIRALLAKLGIEFWTRIPRAAGRGPFSPSCPRTPTPC